MQSFGYMTQENLHDAFSVTTPDEVLVWPLKAFTKPQFELCYFLFSFNHRFPISWCFKCFRYIKRCMKQ